eukprot:TRINITY_DN19507_c0_g2_i1.p1 TRINITY_DN19507_c0_g2~~TRINITY_DN19507_c0_g2_i1.p1  ORF type:complete len:704 (+),score=144.35 TRINITY_DN19507_c0_g2_i1:56-2113(+)
MADGDSDDTDVPLTCKIFLGELKRLRDLLRNDMSEELRRCLQPPAPPKSAIDMAPQVIRDASGGSADCATNCFGDAACSLRRAERDEPLLQKAPAAHTWVHGSSTKGAAATGADEVDECCLPSMVEDASSSMRRASTTGSKKRAGSWWLGGDYLRRWDSSLTSKVEEEPSKPLARSLSLDSIGGPCLLTSRRGSSVKSLRQERLKSEDHLKDATKTASKSRGSQQSSIRRVTIDSEEVDDNDNLCPARRHLTNAIKESCNVPRSKTSWRFKSPKIGQQFVTSTTWTEDPEDEYPQDNWVSRLQGLLLGSTDAAVGGAVVLNGIFIGLQTNHMATKLTETTPTWYFFVDSIFLAFFTFELLCRVLYHRLHFFNVPSWGWNIFDSCLVLMQVAEFIVESFVGANLTELNAAQSVKNLAFVRLLRVMRLLRTLRMARLLQFMGELNVVKQAVLATIRPLIGALLLLVLMSYCGGIFFTQMVATHRIRAIVEKDTLDPRLAAYWGDVARSMLSLFESCFGGIDWDDLAAPLVHIHQAVSLAFIAFVAFVTIAMMNVITGIFVESAVSKADFAKTNSLSKLLRPYLGMDSNTGQDHEATKPMSRRRFEEIFLNVQLREELKEFGVNHGEASILFDFLAADGSRGTVKPEEFLAGMLRLRTNSKFIDTLTLLSSMHNIRQRLNEDSTRCLD